MNEEFLAALENISRALDLANRLSMDRNEQLKEIAKALSILAEEGMPKRSEKIPF